MAISTVGNVLLARPVGGGAALKEWYPHSTVLASLIRTGVVKGQLGGAMPGDTTLVWFDTSDTTHGPDGTAKTHNGTTFVAATGLLSNSPATFTLPARLGSVADTAALIGDWNTATTFGNYYSTPGSLSSPYAPQYWYGYTISFAPTHCTQYAYPYDPDVTSASTNSYRRDQANGVWGAWYQTDLSLAEIQAQFSLAVNARAMATAQMADPTAKATLVAGLSGGGGTTKIKVADINGVSVGGGTSLSPANYTSSVAGGANYGLQHMVVYSRSLTASYSNATKTFTYTFNTPMPDTSYTAIMSFDESGYGGTQNKRDIVPTTKTVSGFTFNLSGGYWYNNGHGLDIFVTGAPTGVYDYTFSAAVYA
jgi:hypothetical protein